MFSHALAQQIFRFQISDWLTLNREMLKQQSIPVGSIDTIAIAIDKQKVSEKWRKDFPIIRDPNNELLFPLTDFRDANPISFCVSNDSLL